MKKIEKDAQRINNEEEQKIREEEAKERLYYNADTYISLYLEPTNKWKPGTKIYQMREDLCTQFIADDFVQTYINSMNYKEFLQTPYWKGIAQIVRKNADFSCELCKSKKNLNVHHTTYEHHGLEHRYYRTDLICLCADCHKKFHGIVEE